MSLIIIIRSIKYHLEDLDEAGWHGQVNKGLSKVGGRVQTGLRGRG